LVAVINAILFTLTHADSDDHAYEYDPSDRSGKADMEGSVQPPENIWHACKFGAKKGGIFDLRALSKNEKLLRAHWQWGGDVDVNEYDWVHQDTTQYNVTYYINVCADVLKVPDACKALMKTDPAPAYQVTATGQCHALGTLKSFQWKPYDTNHPEKGMILFYQNGDPCGKFSTRRSIKFLFTCSKHYDHTSGPLAVYQKDECNYDVLWPSAYGCPNYNILDGVTQQASASPWKWMLAIVFLLGLCGCAVWYMKKMDAQGGYSSL